uniref:Phytochrome kinase substrate 1 n=1 Tax=Davidia involucrata TaxID=16924 RepID=A0A5B6YJU2_DAVIN
MAMVTLTSPCNTNLSQTSSFENNNHHLRDASFSSYLKNAEETFVLKLAESSPAHYLGKKKFEDGEIGVFGAEKYFNGGTDEESPRIANKGAIRHQYEEDDHPVKPKIQPGTPSVYSESSWNSQNALLHGVQRNPPCRKTTNKAHGKSFLASLGYNCPCGDKNSVDVDDNNSNKSVSFRVIQGKTSTTKEPIKTGLGSWLNPWIKEEMPGKNFDELGLGLNREERFSFPVLNSKAGNLAVKTRFQEEGLEVFGSPILEKGKKTLSLERRLTMLTWDAAANPRVEETEIPANSDGIFNDTGSDASSDLFEIESFTNNVNVNSFLTRQASDGMSNNNYAPSEASIEWSVVTASAADFSAMSDSEELRTAATPNKMVPTAKTTLNKERENWRPSLLGCKSQKAVRVAGDAYITREKAIPDPRRRHRPDSFAPVTRFRAETKLAGFDSRNGQQVFDAESVSARSSHLLYIQ